MKAMTHELRPACRLPPAACRLLPAACRLLPAACCLLPAGKQLLWLVISLALAIGACGTRPAGAQGLPGHISYIFPAGGPSGETTRVAVNGDNLDGAKTVRVTGQGVKGELIKVVKGKTAEISLTIDPDAEPGMRDLRLVTPGGVTNRSRFIVARGPELNEQEPNSKVSEAQALPALPVVVNGQILDADKDLFRFSATAGQTIVCRVQAQQLLPFIADAVPGWFQAVLTLYDAEGGHLAYVDDFRFHPDPVLIYQVQRDGEYLVEIRDSIYRGRGDFVYRLSVGELPYVTHIYPLGAPRNSTAEVKLLGVNLPKKKLNIELTNDCAALRYVQLSHGRVNSNSLPFAVGRMAETQESEPNDSMKRANPIEVPITINGRIQKSGDVDCFVFRAQAGQKLVVDVRARRLGSPLDSIITVLDAGSAAVAKNDDTEDKGAPLVTHHADSHLVHTFGATGKYFISIADVQGKGGEEFAYRLVISPPRPDYELRVVPDNPRVGQGATTVLTVHALRRDGFNGRIDLSVEDMPQGFTASGTEIPKGENEVILTLTAPADAPLGIHSPTIVGKAVIGDDTLTRQARSAEDVTQAFIYHHLVPTQEFLLSVVAPGPFKLIPQMPPEGFIRFGAGRTAFLDVKVVRTPQAKGPIRLTLHNPPKGVRMKGAAIRPNEDQAKVAIRIPNQLPPTVRYNLIISGTMRVGKKTLTTITPAILALGPRAKAPPATKRKTQKSQP